jgi:MPBQ/MSBQ methyltransferase
VGLIQHKREAYWFYRFLSLGYDRWVNPLFWTPAMRDEALRHAALDDPALATLDAGAGTGFTTEGIVDRVDAGNVTMLDQSPHQLAKAGAKPALDACRKLLGDAERLPFADDAFDRYVSAGSIEYWPDPQQGIAEAYRVLRPGGRALLIGPVEPGNRILKALASTWMLFPPEADYRAWFERAGFEEVELHALAPDWYRGRSTYAVAVTGTKTGSDLAIQHPRPSWSADNVSGAGLQDLTPLERLRFAGRFVLGSLAGAVFVPIGAVLSRLRR